MVALMVVALALSAAIKLTAQTTNNTATLRDKTYALWVADYQLLNQRLIQSWPEPGERSGEMRMGQRDWPWRLRIESTEDERVRRLTVEVEGLNNQVRLVGFVGKPTQPESTP